MVGETTSEKDSKAYIVTFEGWIEDVFHSFSFYIKSNPTCLIKVDYLGRPVILLN